MPMKAYCSGCGCILWENNSVIAPQEIIKKHQGKCPSCQKALVINLDLLKLGSA